MPETPEMPTGGIEPTSSGDSPPSDQDSGDHKAALERTGFRFGETAPESLQGKTASESANYVRQLEQERHQILGTVQQIVAAQQAAQVQQPQVPQGPDGDLWITDPQAAQAQFQQSMDARTQQMLAQAGTPLYQAQASTAKTLSRQAEGETWQKYGSEIETLMANVPLAQQASPEVWNQAARIVKSNHMDEIVAEKAKSLAATMGAVDPGGTSTAPGTGSQSEALQRIRESDYGKKNLTEYSDTHIQNVALEKMGYKTLDEFADVVTGTNIISNPKNRGQWYNRDLVRDVD